MQMLNPEFQQQFHKEQHAQWLETVVNVNIPHTYRVFALAHVTLTQVDVKAEYFWWLMQQADIPEFNLADAVTFCRACERTMTEWVRFGNKAAEYKDYLTFCEALTVTVNDAVNPIKDSLIRKMQTLQQLQGKAGNRKIALS